MTRLMQLGQRFCTSAGLKTGLAAAAIGVLPAAAMAREHHYRVGIGPVHIDVNYGDGAVIAPPPAPPRGYREVRVWVDPVYRTVTDRQWVAPMYRTVIDHVWVPPHQEVREEERWRHRERRERVFVPGHYEDVPRQELVAEGHYDEIQRQELVTPGHWETRLEPIGYSPR